MPSPKDVLILTLGTCKYVISRGEKDLAAVMKLRILKWGVSLSYPGGPNLITGMLYNGGRRIRTRERGWRMTFEDGGRSQKSRNARSL